MRSSVLLFAGIAGVTGLCLSCGASVLPPVPDTQPSDVPPAADVAPAAAVAPGRGTVSVMVFPFRLINSTTEGDWIASAIDEDMRMELAGNPAIRMASFPAKTPADVDAAIEAGRAGGATYVVYGTYQLMNGQLRVTGSIMRTGDGVAVAPLRVTGDLHDLFGMEDALVAQVMHALPSPAGEVAEDDVDQPPPATNNYIITSAPSATDYQDFVPVYPNEVPDYGYEFGGYGYYYPSLSHGYGYGRGNGGFGVRGSGVYGSAYGGNANVGGIVNVGRAGSVGRSFISSGRTFFTSRLSGTIARINSSGGVTIRTNSARGAFGFRGGGRR